LDQGKNRSEGNKRRKRGKIEETGDLLTLSFAPATIKPTILVGFLLAINYFNEL